MNNPIPHYINERQSDMRGIKGGWYGMDHRGKVSSGPFSSRAECLEKITQPIGPSNEVDLARQPKWRIDLI